MGDKNNEATSKIMHQQEQEAKKTGHIQSLDADQTQKLKEIWKRFLHISRDEGGAARKTASGALRPSAVRSKTDETNITGAAEAAHKSTKADEDKAAENDEQENRAMEELLLHQGYQKCQDAFWDYSILEDPDALMLRFLRARNWNVDKAFAMLASTIKWRLETDVRGILAQGEEGLSKEPGVKKNLSMAKCYFHGTDRQGRPVVYARVKYHKAGEQTQEEMLKYIVYNMETSRSLLPYGAGQETCSVVFDMSGFGLSNMDWDTATLVIKTFQSYYPETLGHAIIWKAPTVFSAVWKIVKPMLDATVREKVHFASSANDIAKFIDPKHLEKDFGGDSSWTYRFKSPTKGENTHMQDKETKEKRLESYRQAARKFEEITERWIEGDEAAGKERRDKLVKEVLIRQFDLDPYVRGKTSFARDGTQIGDGRVRWEYDHGHKEESGQSLDDVAKDLSIEDPPERPNNGDKEAPIALSSDEDTESSTDDSENEILDDSDHKHHHAISVGFAKFGNDVANAFSHVKPGPSLHERQRMKKEEKHRRHEESRKRKLEAKRKRLELEKRHREELEEEEAQKSEAQKKDEINSSYETYCQRMADLALAAVNKAADYVPAIAGGNYIKGMTTTTTRPQET